MMTKDLSMGKIWTANWKYQQILFVIPSRLRRGIPLKLVLRDSSADLGMTTIVGGCP